MARGLRRAAAAGALIPQGRADARRAAVPPRASAQGLGHPPSLVRPGTVHCHALRGSAALAQVEVADAGPAVGAHAGLAVAVGVLAVRAPTPVVVHAVVAALLAARATCADAARAAGGLVAVRIG